MVLSSANFFFFLLVVLALFWTLRRFPLAAPIVIAAANCAFLALWGWKFLLIVPAASAIDFVIGLGLGRFGNANTRRLLISVSILLNAGLIASVRYLPDAGIAWWALPLTLSFYAFQSLTYTLDVYRRDQEPCRNYLAYLSATSFFATILAGPITRVGSLLQQLARPKPLDASDGGRALFLIGQGLTKKLLIADYLADNLINRVFDLPNLYSGGEVLVAVYAFAFQLYYDFSGYTDIAIGSALLLGIKLPQNFNAPYSATNISDFWRRWHISLSNWLRDYLYFSLPGLRSKWKVFAYLNLVITMAIGGIWHGASWNFLIWGLLHGFGLAGFRLWQSWRGTREPSLWGRVLTFHFVLLAWVFFRASTLPAARDILERIASFTLSFANVTPAFLLVLGIAVSGHYIPKDWYERIVKAYVGAPFYVQAAAMAGLIVAIQYVATTGAAPFIYTRF